MCESKLNEILSRTPTLTNSSDRNLPHPMINNYSHIPYHEQGES